MKKILGILGVAVIAMAIFFSTNNVNNINKGDLSILNLVGLQQAQAEEGDLTDPFFKGNVCNGDSCQDANWISFRTRCDPNNPSGKCVDGDWVIVINNP